MANKQTGSFDLAAGKKASQTADNYITEISNDGVFVHTSGDSSISTGSGVHIGASAINIIKSGVSYIKAWISNANIPYIRIGREDKGNVLIDNDSVDIRDGTTVSASFGANNVTLGNPTNTPHVIMTPRIMTYYDADGDPSAILHYDADPSGNTKTFIISSESDSQDTASLRLQSADYASTGKRSNIELVAQNAPDEGGEDPATVALLLNGRGATLTYSGDTTLGSGLFRVSMWQNRVFEVGMSGYSIRSCDGVISYISASSFKRPTAGTITSVTAYRHNGIIYMSLGFKNTASVAAGGNVLDTYLDWNEPTSDIQTRFIKPALSSYGVGYYGKTPLMAFFGASDGHFVVRNTSPSAVTVSTGATVTISWVAPLEGFSST